MDIGTAGPRCLSSKGSNDWFNARVNLARASETGARAEWQVSKKRKGSNRRPADQKWTGGKIPKPVIKPAYSVTKYGLTLEASWSRPPSSLNRAKLSFQHRARTARYMLSTLQILWAAIHNSRTKAKIKRAAALVLAIGTARCGSAVAGGLEHSRCLVPENFMTEIPESRRSYCNWEKTIKRPQLGIDGGLSLHRNRFCQIAGLVDVGALCDGDVIGK
jgi:hypothetical protein